MDQDTMNSVVFKLNLLVDKVLGLEYKFDVLNSHLKHKRQQEANKEDGGDISGAKTALHLSPSQLKLGANNGRAVETLISKDLDLTTAYDPALDNIFKVMDSDTLKSIRLVCKSWNQKAVPVLSSKTWIQFHKWEIEHDDEPIPLDNIYKMMDSTVDGLVLFKNVSFTYSCFQLRELETQVILREFGMNLVSISLDSPNIPVVKQVLDQWCPNLEELIIVCTRDIAGDNDYVLNTTLKLKSLKMIPTQDYVDVSNFVFPLIEIAKSSPFLSSISLGERTTCSDFFLGIIQYPEIIRNVTKLDIVDGNEEIDFDTLCLPKVTKLNIRNKCSWVTPLISKVQRTLTTLTLGFPKGSYFEDDDSSDPADDDDDDGDHNIFNSKSETPDLDAVKVFKLKGFLPTNSSLRALECKKMKNLQVLYINVNQGDLDTVLLKSDLYDPIINLRKLTLIGSISCALSFQILVALFPNVIKLKLGLARKYQSDYSMSDCLKDGLPKFASLENLQSLSLHFDCSICDSVEEIIGKLKDYSGLSEFELGNFDRGHEVVYGLFSGIQQLPVKVSRIKLVNIVLTLTEAQNVLDEIKSRGIRLQITEDSPFRETM